MAKALVGSNVKGGFISVNTLDELIRAQVFLTGGESSDLESVYRNVPWLFRGVNLRAQAVADLPFTLYRGDDEIDSSTDWQNEVGFLPAPKALLYLIEAALTLLGKAYLFREQNRISKARGTLSNLRYLVPTVIEPDIDEVEGLKGFTRRLNGMKQPLSVEQIVYFWYPDVWVELGPPKSAPAQAALKASGVLLNIDTFAEEFFKRGAIRATILTVKGNPPPQEKDRIKEWWGSFVTGIKNAFSTSVFNADAIEPVVVGEGISELSDNNLTATKREDISTALGIPQTKLFSSSASGLGGGGVVEQDDVRFLNDTVIPEANFIAHILNEQVFEPLGLRLRFTPEVLDAFQEDESQRAGSLATFLGAVNAAKDWNQFEAAALLLGYELSDDIMAKLKASFDAKDARREGMAAQLQPSQPPAPEPEPDEQEDGGEEDANAEAKRLERKRYRAVVKKNPAKAQTFRFEYLDEVEQRQLKVEAQANGEDSLVPFSHDTPNIKSIATVTRQFCARLKQLIKDYWKESELDPNTDLNGELRSLIEYHVSAAYFEGLKQGGIEPEDFDADMSQRADDLVMEQLEHVGGFVDAIGLAHGDKDKQAVVLVRADLWCNAVDVAGQAGLNEAKATEMVEFGGDDGEESCATCQRLKGKRHRRQWFVDRGLVPGQPGNENFECQGYRCQHVLIPVVRG